MLLVSMFLSIVFIVVDVCASVIPNFSSTDGINPYWKFALVFKCFCDTIILDDFKTALEKLRRGVFETYETVRYDDGEDIGPGQSRRGGVDRRGKSRHMSIPISPKATRTKTQGMSHFGSISQAEGQADHLEVAPSTDHSSSSRYSNEMVKKEGIELEPQGRGNRRGQAREAVGKVGTKLAQLPSLGIATAFKKHAITSERPPPRPYPSGETTYSPLDPTRTTESRPLSMMPDRKSIPDPHHIPTDEELEADPTGWRAFEERRRVQVSREETDRMATALPPGHSLPIAHPGQPWGFCEEDYEPWGVNQVAQPPNGHADDYTIAKPGKKTEYDAEVGY